MNPYLDNGFAPLGFETVIDSLEVEGQLPEGLRGTLYRIGPNPRFAPIEPYNPLLADGMVHAVRCGGDGVAYRNRWVRTRQWQLEDHAGRALFATSGDPRRHDPSVAGAVTDGVANTSLVHHGGRLLALEEGHAPIELDPSTLETRGVWNFAGALARNMTAHPKLDPLTGEMVFFANEPDRTFSGRIAWYAADATGRIVLARELETPFASMMHDFAVTRDFVVFLVCPVTISLGRARRGEPALAWQPERRLHVAVVNRDGSDGVRWFERASGFVWHVQNAWNDGAALTLDLCEQQAPAFPAVDGSMTDETTWRTYLTRWRLDLSGAAGIRVERASYEVCEYPRIDERFAMCRTRHGYFACRGGPGTGDPFQRAIAHYDDVTGRMKVWPCGARRAVSEPVFVPAARGCGEGEGWLLCMVHDETTDTGHMAVLDARHVERGPVARVMVPHRVPLGFHGCWVPD